MPASAKPQQITLEQGAFDAQVSNDGFANISLLTGDMEVRGHGMFADDKTVEGCLAAIGEASVPSYLTHAGAIEDDGPADRLGKEIGFAKGAFRDGNKVRAASFKFLNSFGTYAAETKEKLLEIARDYPEQLGISLVAMFRRVWVLNDGTEVDGSEPRPENAIRDLPSMRILKVASADLVQRPAVNMGLFSARVDAPSKGMANETIALSAHTAALAAKDAEIATLKETHVTALSSLKSEHAAALTAKDTSHAAALAAKVLELTTAHTTALSAKEEELKQAKVFDCRLIGTPEAACIAASLGHPIKATVVLPKPAKTDGEMWEQYSALKKQDSAKAEEFYEKYLSPSRK